MPTGTAMTASTLQALSPDATVWLGLGVSAPGRKEGILTLKEAGVDDLDIALITGQSPKGIRDLLDRHYLVPTALGAERVFRQRLAAEKSDSQTS